MQQLKVQLQAHHLPQELKNNSFSMSVYFLSWTVSWVVSWIVVSHFMRYLLQVYIGNSSDIVEYYDYDDDS